MKGYNWAKIKTERKAGKSIKGLVAKYTGYNENDKEFRGKYAYFRKKLKDTKEDEEIIKRINDKVEEKTIEKLAESEMELRVEYNKINKNIRRAMANELFNKKTKFNRLKELKISSEILHNCRKMDWEIHEIQEVAKRIEQQLDVKNVDGVSIELIDDES